MLATVINFEHEALPRAFHCVKNLSDPEILQLTRQMRDHSTSASPKPKAKWYIRPLSIVFMLSLMGINTAIDNAKIDPSWVLRTLFLVIAGGVAVAIWYSEKSAKRSASGASPNIDILRELGQALGVSRPGGSAVPNASTSPINWTLALVFQAVLWYLASFTTSGNFGETIPTAEHSSSRC